MRKNAVLMLILALVALMAAADPALAARRKNAAAQYQARLEWLLKRVDTNRDNRASEEEWISYYKELFDYLDVIKDGSLDGRDTMRLRQQLNLTNPYRRGGKRR